MLTGCELSNVDAGREDAKGPAKAKSGKGGDQAVDGKTHAQTASLYLNLDGFGRALKKVTAVCVEVLWTQSLAVKSVEQA